MQAVYFARYARWCAPLLLVLALFENSSADVILGGHLAVVRVASASPLSANAVATFIDEYDTTTPNQSIGLDTIAMPTAASGTNHKFTLSGTGATEGVLTLSVDGRYLNEMGYDALPGVASVTTNPANSNPRVLARVEVATGKVDTSNFFNSTSDAFSGSAARSAVSTDGVTTWMAGSGSPSSPASGGVRSTTLIENNTTANSSQRVDNSAMTVRTLNIYHNQLYVSAVSSTSSSLSVVSMVGSGLPGGGSNSAVTPLPGMPTSGAHGAYDFWFKDANTLYVADDGAPFAGGGIQKWSFDGTNWGLAYVLLNNAPASSFVGTATTPVRHLTGTTDANGNAVLFATTSNGVNVVIKLTDMGSQAASLATQVTLVQSSGTNMGFRGLAYIPIPEANSLVAVGLMGGLVGLVFSGRRRWREALARSRQIGAPGHGND